MNYAFINIKMFIYDLMIMVKYWTLSLTLYTCPSKIVSGERTRSRKETQFYAHAILVLTIKGRTSAFKRRRSQGESTLSVPIHIRFIRIPHKVFRQTLRFTHPR